MKNRNNATADEKRMAILERYRQVHRVARVARELKVSYDEVRRILVEEGVFETTVRRSEIVNRFAETGIAAEVARELGISRQRVWQVLRLSGVAATRLSGEDLWARNIRLIARYEELGTLAQVAKEFAITESRARQILKEGGVQTRHGSNRRKNGGVKGKTPSVSIYLLPHEDQYLVSVGKGNRTAGLKTLLAWLKETGAVRVGQRRPPPPAGAGRCRTMRFSQADVELLRDLGEGRISYGARRLVAAHEGGSDARESSSTDHDLMRVKSSSTDPISHSEN